MTAKRASAPARDLTLLGLDDAQVRASESHGRLRIVPAWSMARVVTAAPFALAGALVHAVPYQVTKRIGRIPTNEGMKATVKLLGCFFSFTLLYIGLGVLAGFELGPVAGVGASLAAPACGYVTVLFSERVKRLGGALAGARAVRRRGSAIESVLANRRAVVDRARAVLGSVCDAVTVHRRFSYGPQRAQVCDLWLPSTGGGEHDGARPAPPVVVLFHGGFWRALYTKVLMRGMAAAVVSRGWAAWNVEYRRVGPGGGGGGWPATLEDVSAAMGRLSSVPGVDTGRVAVCGHSAGGQLALWAAGEPGVTVHAAVSLAGVLDLEDAATCGLGGGAVQSFLGGSPDEVPERYAKASPAARLPLGVPQLVVHGSHDVVVPPAMSVRYCESAAAAGDDVRYHELPGAGHKEVTTGRGQAFGAVADYLEEAFS